MLLIDANAILRYILCDNKVMAESVCELITNNKVTVRHEVAAEVVYVLQKVYSVPKTEIADCFIKFLKLKNVDAELKEVLFAAVKTFADTNFDFVDCVLYSLHTVCGYGVFSFDKKLNSAMKRYKE